MAEDAHGVHEQAQLLAGLRRPAEVAGVELQLAAVEAEALAGEFEAPADGPGIGAGAGLAHAEGGVVFLAAAR